MKSVFSMLFVAGIGLGTAHASLTFYPDNGAWLSHVSGVTSANFEGIAPDSDFVTYPSGVTVGGVDFSVDTATNNGSLFVVGDGFYYPYAVLSSQDFGDSTNLVAKMPSPTTAFSGVIDTWDGSDILHFTLDNGDSFVLAGTNFGDSEFVGFTSSTPFSSFRVDFVGSHSAAMEFQSFAYGQFQAVPEPMSLAVIGLGVGLIARRRKKSA